MTPDMIKKNENDDLVNGYREFARFTKNLPLR
jgi:hypothetical protein